MVAHPRAPLRADRLRALNLPRPVAVTLDAEGLPTAVSETAPDATATAVRAVEAVLETWRVDDEWWRDPISRRYFDVVFEGGGHVVLFEDLVSRSWYMQRP